MNINFDIQLTKSQQEAYDLIKNNKYRNYVFAWSRQSGKSTLMKVLCIEWLLNNKVQIAYICRNYILAKKLYKDLVQIIPNELIRASNGTDLTITSVFDSTLTFFSAESGASLRGQTFHYLICDEFAFFKFEQTDGTHLWNDILFPTIKVNGQKIIFVSTPLGKNNIFYEFFLRGEHKQTYHKWKSLKKTIYDDGLITNSEIEEIKQQIPHQSFQQEFMCEFLDDSTSFFVGFEKCFDKYQYNNNIKQWIGIDLSGDGKDATILTKVNDKGQTKQFEINGNLDTKYREISNIINQTNNLQGAYIEINGLGAPMFNEIKKLVKDKNKLHEWQTTNSSKERIISNLAVQIANKEVTFDIENKNLYVEFGTFVSTYSKSGNLILAAKAGNHDDRVMSLAIAMEAKRKLVPFQSSNIKFLDNSLANYNLV